jgi:hypothetical protein
VTGYGVPDDDMRSFPQPRRQEGPAPTDADLAALLAGTDGAAPGLGPVADILAALTAEATSRELAGEDRALAEFRRRAGAPETQTTRVRTTGLTSRLGTKVAAAAAGMAVVLAGAATAAFANVLPAPIQRFAHEIIGAPAPAVQQGAPNRGQPAAPAVPASPGRPPAHGAPRAAEHPSPHATAPGSPRGKGWAGSPHTPGKHGNPHGSGQQGNGQGGQGNGQGQGGQGNHGHGKTYNGHRQHGRSHATVHRAASRPGSPRRKPGAT